MASERDNQVQRCRHNNCRRATFVETEEGISADFRHGTGRPHREVYTIDQMVVYLASRGYVVMEAAKIIKAA